MSDEHQLDDSDFGIRGIEKSQNWSPMVSADPVSSPDDLPADSIMTESDLAHAKRPVEADWGEFTEREYYNNATGEPTPERQSVSPEQAGKDLANVREQERQAREDAAAQDLRSALDQTGQQPPAQQDQPQPETFEPQPDELQQIEGMDDDAKRAFAESKWAEADAEISKVLENPIVRERVEAEFNQVRAQAAEAVQAAQTRYEMAVGQLGQEIGVVTAALIPEIQGMTPEQAQGALGVLAKTNPARFEQITQFANKIQGAINLTQQQAMARQQQQTLIAEAQQQQAAEAFKQYAEAEDARALAGETPETISTIRKTILGDAKVAGISEKDLYQAYNTIPALRHSFVQGLMADGAKWRASQRGLASHRRNPVPAVQRPGTSVPGPRVHDGDLAAAASRFNLPGGNEGPQGLRNAAAWITAKRGARG